MDNMIRRPRPQSPRRPQQTEPATTLPPVAPPVMPTTDTSDTPPPLPPDRAPKRQLPRLKIIVGVVIGLLILALGAWLYYLDQLQPVDRSDDSAQKVVIKTGQSFGEVAQTLQERSLIRSPLAFEIMARLAGKHNDVKAGTCTLKRTETAAQILEKITSGCHDFKAITFYPGATLHQSHSKPTSLNVTDVLLSAGYSQSAIDAALARSYKTHGIDLFAGKPAGADLEGYVYGETYYVDTDATVEDVLQVAFDQMAGDIAEGGYAAKFQAHGLNLYQGITLASIIQREFSCTSGATACYQNQQKIAQIFYTRLASSMTLGSDVTFYYAADKQGVDPSVDIDSPYNTRRYPGLPPGPIASPGKHALDAVANPASTDYLFFVAGDDGNVYFARTDAEHQANVQKHCQILCSQL